MKPWASRYNRLFHAYRDSGVGRVAAAIVTWIMLDRAGRHPV